MGWWHTAQAAAGRAFPRTPPGRNLQLVLDAAGWGRASSVIGGLSWVFGVVERKDRHRISLTACGSACQRFDERGYLSEVFAAMFTFSGSTQCLASAL